MLGILNGRFRSFLSGLTNHHPRPSSLGATAHRRGLRPTLELLEDRLVPVTLPPGFSQTLFATGLSQAVALSFAPDGKLFVTQQKGALAVFDNNGNLLQSNFFKNTPITVDSTSERGLLGLTFDPNYETNHYLYVYYTAVTPTTHNRVSRFTADGSGTLALAGSETPLLDSPPLVSVHHNAGSLHFGPDGKLYISSGNNFVDNYSQSLANDMGKILRINSDGSIPTDNPFYNSTTGQAQAIYALGLRNPFTFNFQPGTGRMFINDVGANSFEEVDEGFAGANYGWPYSEGFQRPGDVATTLGTYHDPIYQHTHGTNDQNGAAITGACFYNPPNPQYPGQYIGDYFFGDYSAGFIHLLDPANGYAEADFVTGLGNHVIPDITVGPDGNIYYIASGLGVYKVQFIGPQRGGLSPEITQTPGDQTVAPGNAVTFSVSAIGTGPFSYQWQDNGTSIAGATSSSYTFPSVTTADNASLVNVTVSNAYGTTTTDFAVLTVTDPPVITSQIGSRIVSVGQAVTFTIGAAGDGPLSYQWYRNNVAISGATSASYAIASVAQTDIGATFKVVVSNAAGTVTSKPATLTAGVPTITQNPASQTVDVGQAVTFTAAASGGSLAYQWLRNGVVISGAIGSSYTLPSAAASDSGSTFAVYVTNATGVTTSAAATLTVNGPPLILQQPVAQTVFVGQSVTFNVAATGTGPLTHQWQENATNIDGATSSSYTFASPAATDNGDNFDVIVSNSQGTATSMTVSLTVTSGAPVIGLSPQSLTLDPGLPASFLVIASGQTPLSYQWQRNGVDIPGATSSSYSLSSVAASDNGATFDVVVSNGQGTVTSASAVLTVIPVLPGGLVDEWAMDEHGGALAGDSVGGNNATLIGNPAFVAANRPGGGGNALQLNGVSQFAQVANAPSLDGTAQVTITLWANPSLLDGKTRALVSKRVNYLTGWAYSLFFGAGNRLYVDFNGNGDQFASNTVFNTNTWYFLAVTFDGTQPRAQRVKLYVNGTLDITAPSSTTAIPHYASNLFIGNMNNPYSPTFAGLLDDVRIFRSALGAGDIQNVMNGPEISGAPIISQQPTSPTVSDGQPAMFSVTATGEAPLSYQWQRNGVNIAGATSATYALAAAGLVDNGALFDVVVSNAIGSATSGLTALVVNPVPITFTQQPANQTILAGQPSTFSVATTGSAPMTFQWQRNGVNIDGATSSSYTIPAVAAADNGATFDLVVKNPAGKATSSTATLLLTQLNTEVDEWPFLETSGTTSADILGGDNANLVNGPVFVTANRPGSDGGGNALQLAGGGDYARIANASSLDGTAQLTLTLWANASVLDGSNRPLVSKRASDGSNNSYSLFFGAGNQLYVDIDGNNDEFASNTVFNPNTWYFIAVTYDGTQPPGQRVNLYVNGVLDITASESSSSIPHYASDLFFGAFDDETSPTFAGMIDDVRIYTGPLASNDIQTVMNGSDNTGAPLLFQQPFSQTVADGQSVTFQATAIGLGTLSYQWQRNGVNISGATASTYSLAAASLGDSGASFDVVISNSVSSTTSAAATLNVTPVGPTIVQPPVDQTAFVGQPATFSVTASGSAPLSYQWQRNGVNIAGATSSFYTLASTSQGDEGATFDVIVTNVAGSVTSSSATLHASQLNTLVDEWSFAESGGTTAADSVGGNTANLVNGPTFVAANRPGGGGNALHFSGNHQYAQVPNAPSLDGTSQLTLSFWVNPSFLGNLPLGLISKRSAANSNNAYSVYFGSGHKLYFTIDGSAQAASNTVFSTNTWYYITVVFDGSLPKAQRIKLFVNGVLDVTALALATTIPHYASDLFFGALDSNSSTFFNGMLDDIRIYQAALNANDIQTVMNSTEG
jgi:glucose/arabinose dehydrogenase